MSVWRSKKAMITDEGGLAVQYKNQTGEVSVKGTTVHITAPWTVGKTQVNVPDCIGVIYNSGVPIGEWVWVVVSGIADVLFTNQTTAGYLGRTFVTADAGGVAGKALSEAVPTPPFASDKHWAEMSHIIETNSGPNQLAKCNLHFN